MMRSKVSKRIISVLLAFVMVAGLIPAAAMPVRAQNVIGLINASGIRANEGVVLYGDTTLNMDTDLTVPSIEGDYNLTIQGSGKLTVNGGGNGIDVKSLNCSSDLFIQTGRHAIEAAGAVYIHNAESFIVGGIYAGGHIDIQCSNATIGGNDYAISSALGSITLTGGTFDIGANGVAVFANVGDITMDGDFTVNSNDGRTIDAREGAVTINGSLKSTSGAKFDPEVHFANRDWFSIGAASGFSFYGTTLEVTGLGGILAGINAGDTDISITADSVSVITERYYALYGENIYVDSDELWLENEGSEENENVIYDFDTVYAEKDVTLSSESGGIVGEIALTVFGTLTLNGNFVAGGDSDHDFPLIIANRMEANGNLVLRNSTGVAVETSEGFSFNGTTLDIEGFGGIEADGDVNITADSVVITTDVGTTISGNEVYVTANDLWAENKATKADSDWSGQYGISATSKLALTVKGGTVIGYEDALHVYDGNDEFEYHYIYVDGSLTVVSKTGAGMYVPQGNAELQGGPMVSVGETHGIYADNVYFDGGSLRIDGNTGIYAKNSVELSGEDIKITAFGERNSGIWNENGSVDLEGKVTINTNGWYGINAGGDLTLGEGYFEISGPEGNAQAVKVGGKLYMDGTLEIVKPTYGHVNGNDIYGAGDSPALEVLIYSAISNVSLLIDPPRAGELPTRNASGIYFLDPRCTVEEIVWYEDGVEMVSQDAKFRAGHSYTVKITISADGDYYFVEGVMGKVNDKSVSTGTKEKKIMYLTADMGECPNAVDIVELEITAPVEGKTPSTAVTDPSSEYGVYSRNVRWAVSTDGINFVSMASGEKFVGGKYYRVFMDVNLAGNDYKFPVTTATGSVQPDVISYVNGNRAVTEKAYDQDPETVITVYFDFGKCNDFIIEEVTIVDVVAPVAGQRPTYTANMFGTGYHIDTTKNSYEDIYWKNPPEKWYYVKNGVQWWDTTTGSYEYVYEHDTFIPGHTYSCTIYVCVDDGFTFARSNGVTLLTATLNGNPANIVTGWTDTWNTRVTYTFTCEENVVDRIVVDGITAPKAGNLPDYTAVLGHPGLYQLDTDYGLNGSGIYWYDCEGRQLQAGERFGDAGPYRIAIKFVPASAENGGYVSQFADDVEVIINGKSVTPYGDWDDVMVGSGTAWAFFTFRNSASAPELGVTVSGKVTSYQNASGDITLQLCDYSSGSVAYETTVKGNTVAYSFADVAAGVYTLRVSKENHVTREYMVIVNSGAVVQDVTICLKGDVTGDGSVNLKDFQRLLRHVNKTNPLEGYALECGDITGEGNCNIKDFQRLLRHVNKTNPLF